MSLSVWLFCPLIWLALCLSLSVCLALCLTLCFYPSVCPSGWLALSLFVCLLVLLAGSVSIRLSVGLAGWFCLSYSLSHSTTVSYSHLSGVFNADTRYAVSHLNKFVLVFFCFLTRREMRVPFDEEMIHFFILFRMTEWGGGGVGFRVALHGNGIKRVHNYNKYVAGLKIILVFV